MQPDNLVAGRKKRLYAIRMAAHIGQMSRKTAISTEQLSWDELSSLPPWCLLDSVERKQLQRVCGAVYLSPLVRRTIDGSLLREVRSFVGDDVFMKVRRMNWTNHPVNGDFIYGKVPFKVMASGSSVLLGTLRDQTVAELYKASIGPPAEDIDDPLATEIYHAGCQILET